MASTNTAGSREMYSQDYQSIPAHHPEQIDSAVKQRKRFGCCAFVVLAIIGGAIAGIVVAVHDKHSSPSPAAPSTFDGVYSVPRNGTACQPLTATIRDDDTPDNLPQCPNGAWGVAFHRHDLDLLIVTAEFTDANDVSPNPIVKSAALGPLYAYQINGGQAGWTFVCPPIYYPASNAGPPVAHCNPKSGTVLASVQRNNVTGEILRIDIMRSGPPFPVPLPPVTDPTSPFGVASFSFETSPIAPLGERDLLVICSMPRDAPRPPSGRCPAPGANALSLKGLEFTALGKFTTDWIDQHAILQPSNWYQSDSRKLLVIAPQPGLFWFNGTAAITDPGCAVIPVTYQDEVYNYDSRFLDYIGEWNILRKVASDSYPDRLPAARRVRVYAGVAIDAVGVFPVLMWMEPKPERPDGYYVGLDRIDPNGPSGSSYWYSRVVAGRVDFDALPASYFPSGCPADMRKQWDQNLLNKFIDPSSNDAESVAFRSIMVD